jgi:UDP-N-acetylglucosamine diphosphorylase/glucosamine-1-phosphate N-acetyltransferase
VLDASGGPIHLDDGATVMAQAVLRGPAYVGPKAQIKVGANVTGSAIGFWCKLGGEVHDSVLHSLTNKAHAGFLGHSYLGRWCNLGADTNTSNLKNDYGEVTLYDTETGAFEPTGRQFVGVVMGDHSKCGINTMFDTGTIVGVSCNLFGAGFPARHVPSFSWGGPESFTTYRLDKALQVADTVMRRRDRHLTDADRENLEAIFERWAKGEGANRTDG